MIPPGTEGLVLQVGSLIILSLGILRVIVYDYRNLRDDMKPRKRRRR